MTPVDRFIVQVDRSGGEAACWLWTGTRNRHRGNYGQFRVSARRPIGAHRFAYAISKGAIPAGLRIRHDCDNPPCVNPAHLRVGTHAENVADMWERGRGVEGLRHPSHRKAMEGRLPAKYGRYDCGHARKREQATCRACRVIAARQLRMLADNGGDCA